MRLEAESIEIFRARLQNPLIFLTFEGPLSNSQLVSIKQLARVQLYRVS